MTQQEFADSVGLHFTTISKIERGHIAAGRDALHAFAETLNVEPIEMFRAAGRIQREMTRDQLEAHVINLERKLEECKRDRAYASEVQLHKFRAMGVAS
jgi:transcriptional regulator with XRE-family HTH domain